MRKHFIWIVISIHLINCSSPPPNKFSDPVLIDVYELQDRRQTSKLIEYLANSNQVYRAEAALALASVQDSIAAWQLGNLLLEDSSQNVRMNAAFALGQIGSNGSVNALIPALIDSNSYVVNEVLQALGKCVSNRDLQSLVNFKPKDSIQEQGLAWGFYYAGLRGIVDSSMVSRAENLLGSQHSTGVRLGAAHFFNRANNLKDIPVQSLSLAARDKDASVRMAAVLSLRKASGDEPLSILSNILSTESDYRVRVNTIRVIAGKANSIRDSLVLLALKDNNPLVVVATAEAILPGFSKLEDLLTIARTSKNFRVQASLYKVLLIQNAEQVGEVLKLIESSTNDYQKAALIGALSSQIKNYNYLNEFLKSNIPVIKTSAAHALVSINRNKLFTTELTSVFAEIYKEALLGGDAGVISIIASALADSTLNYKSSYTDLSFLHQARNKLILPRDYEAIQPLEDAITYLEGKQKPKSLINDFNHPINWDLVKKISSKQTVKISTSKGEIVLGLLIEEVPGSVVNFIELVNQKYFNGRFVHRVVPNFVIQTGCNRGDGFGSENYSIRSEFSLRRYDEGSVGMASAGKDTEGTQWFITHSPTPHLNGRYTLFAHVVSGMDVVHKIEVGDQILDVHLVDN